MKNAVRGLVNLTNGRNQEMIGEDYYEIPTERFLANEPIASREKRQIGKTEKEKAEIVEKIIEEALKDEDVSLEY